MIYRFDQTADYLSIVNGAIITDLIVLFTILNKNIKSHTLQEWYKKYNLSAVLADVLILVIGVILTRFFYPFLFSSYHLFAFLGLAVGVQMVHDILFYLFLKVVPENKSPILDTFKAYAKEMGALILSADAAMMISTILIASALSTLSYNANIIVFIVSLYLIPYFVYSV